MTTHQQPHTLAKRNRLTRTLELVRLDHGQLTTRRVISLTGWTQRSVERYLNELRDDGLVVRDYRAEGAAHRWRLTDEGRQELLGARAA
jgi:predicted transcriptional regulator